MKLWQKTFIWTLIIVMIAVSSTSIIILKNNYDISIDRQITNTLSEHEYLISNIKNRIITERRKQSAVLLQPSQILDVFQDIMAATDSKEKTTIALYDEEGQVQYHNMVIKISDEFYNAINSSQKTHKQIVRSENRHWLLIGSSISLEQQDYIFISSTDISEIYTIYEEQLEFTKWFTISISLESALFLLVLIKLLMVPLTKLNRATKRIAGGDYSERITIKGRDELSELAENMNIMADSVEENITLLSETAENRRQFINNLTHEMKTPLTSILGFADIIRIKRNITPKELSEYSGIIFEEAKRLKNLSGKLMELITVGETNLEFVSISSRELINQIQLVLKPILDKNNITLITECDESFLTVDCELFKSMILNLIDNAIKASKSGKNIYLTGTSGEHSSGTFTITVRDEGIGIAADELNKITEPFYMVDKARSRKAGGAGLGLALCKRIAEIHHADFHISSTLGAGTTITITLTPGDDINEK